MNQISGNQWFCLLVVALLVLGGVGIALADALGARRLRRRKSHQRAEPDYKDPL